MTDGAEMRRGFGANVRAGMAANGISLADLAARTELTERRTDAILRGDYSRLSLAEMSILATAVGVPLDRLLQPDAGIP